MSESVITYDQVSKSFRNPRTSAMRQVLSDFSLSVAPGELVAIVGPSGIGKTTLLHLAAGLDQPDSGSVQLHLPPGHRRVGMVFQQPRLLDWRSVEKNVHLATDAAGVPAEQGTRMLDAVQLAQHRHSYPLSLSGGERQRVALARAFAIEPGLILMDEPFSALDELTGRKLQLLTQSLWQQQSPTGLIITHNTMEAVFLADRVLVLGGQPCRIEEVVPVPLPRPRTPDDVVLFECQRRVVHALTRAEAAIALEAGTAALDPRLSKY